jgi:hypothetical protein
MHAIGRAAALQLEYLVTARLVEIVACIIPIDLAVIRSAIVV